MRNSCIRTRWIALCVLIAGVPLAPIPALAADACMPYWTESYKRMQGCLPDNSNSGGNSGLSRRQIREMEEAAEDAAREDRARRTNALNQQAGDAWARGDYRQALSYFEQQQTVIDGPNVRLAIAQTKAMIVWKEARTAADYRRALAMAPGMFSQENIRYVEELEAKEKYERERPEREAQWERERLAREAADRKSAAKMRERIGSFAASLDTEPAKAGRVVPVGRAVEGAMGGNAVEAPLEFGNPDDLEARSEQLQQGFDDLGPLKGSRPPATVDDPASRDPRVIEATQELDRLQAERARMDAEIAGLTRERNASIDAVQMKALTAELEQKNRAKQEKLLEISEKKGKAERLRRTINTQVEKQEGNAK